MISKSELRKQLLNKRKKLNTKELSKSLCKKIVETEEYKTAKNIFAYYPKEYEVDISSLFNNKEKNWFLPRVVGEEMEFIKYNIGDKLIKSEFGVFEPTGEKTLVIPDLIIVPSLSVDKNSYRLGYGKGFYDRFLSNADFNNVTTLSPIYSELIVEKIPTERHDKFIDIVLTD